MTRVGLVADTHGRVRPEALDALRDCSLILHAGDVGGRHVLDALRALGPLHAVRGNVDDPYDPDLVDRIALDVEGLTIHVSHGHELGQPTPEALVRRYTADIVVFGHTHQAVVRRLDGRLVVNPGAAGAARFGGAVSVARLTIAEGRAEVEIVPLAP